MAISKLTAFCILYSMICNNFERNWDDQNWSKQPFLFYSVHLTVERTFSDMKLTKTQLRSTLEEVILDQTLKLCTEGPPTLSDEIST